ncbi:phage antirepressor N-terminal domain-containing protein [Vibrio sp. Isolate24]|uniref:phage antirepressor N-terminal domain-containing protein n=1 Tax=Vibrio sp. Isolate24 TaxID=2908534 RepID=UPI001EFCAF78|nr:phage antirepressor N-terminal domain-containing protein [Vibrio sp. Isolate24]MCG9678764.1 phage antirepressor N-terminal domain-containing protein [Vibrio sp. Isolate24]
MSSSQITVPFHGSNLTIVEHNGEPYTPMKPIVEGMGMEWSYQSRKLSNNSSRWSVAVIATVAQDNKTRDTLCLPLRKLFGWLQTLQPNRVRVDIRDKVIQYQNECDDVLWKYWSKQNEDPIMPVMPPKTMRLLMVMEKGHVVSTQIVPEDSVVFRLEEIPKLLREPGYFTVDQLKEVANTAVDKITEVANNSLSLLR